MQIINIINTIFCFIILIVGILAYIKGKDLFPLLIAIAFGLFGVSHIFELMNLVNSFEVFLIIIRFLAYLLVVFGIFYSYMKAK